MEETAAAACTIASTQRVCPMSTHCPPAPPSTPWLVDEAIFKVVDAYRAERALSKVEDLVTTGWAVAGNQVHLVVSGEVDFVSPIAQLLTLLQLVGDVRIQPPRRKSGTSQDQT
jgi:hypothetical protein